jgi:hypothetical protein
MLYANYIGLLLNNCLVYFNFLITIFSLLFFIFTIFLTKIVSITNSVIFLFKLELKQFNISKILPMWKIGVYIVLIITI